MRQQRTSWSRFWVALFILGIGALPGAAGAATPKISGMPPTSMPLGTWYWFTPTASDTDGDKLTFSIQNKPVWATFNTATGNLLGAPSASQAGTYGGIVISVSDGTSSASLPPFSITVVGATTPAGGSGANSAPKISGTPPTSMAVGTWYWFTPTASDSDGDKLTFSIQNKPVWITFNTATGNLLGAPSASQAGTYSGIVISVTDGTSTASLPAFSITVGSGATGTTAPLALSGQPATSVTQGSPYSFVPTVTGGDGSALTFGIQNRPSWATFSGTTGQLAGTPTTAGVFSNIVISASNRTASASLTAFSIAVAAALGPPAPPASSGTLYIYQNGAGTGANYTNAIWDVDLSYSVTINGHDKTVAQKTYDMRIAGGGGWQPAAHNFGGNNGYGVGPYGHDTHAYTYLTLDLYPTDSTYPFDMQSHYVGSYNGANGPTDTVTPSWITDISRIVGPLSPNTWNKGLKIPLSSLGQLGQWAQYKFFLREHTNSSAGVYYVDNVGFAPGNYSWIYDGGANNGAWNPGGGGQGQGNWGNDAATLLNGWKEASTGATINYSQDPSKLPVTGSLNGVTQPGLNAIPTKVIAVTGVQSGGKWAVSHSGFATANYDHLTIALLPTGGGYNYTASVNGSSVNLAKYTDHDWGPNSTQWTVYNIPLSAFGSPSSITSLSVQDTATKSPFYITAPGFYE
jgi:hypothetical protein